jgi:cytoskeleton protein RodZ
MQSVGQQIREQRLRLGLKLEDIAARSRISLKTLQAIETDDLAAISSPFLYKSFARQFAEHLKLDYALLAPGVDAAGLTMPQPRMPGEGDFGKTNIAPMPIKGRSRNFRWLYSVGSLAVVLVACSSVYGVWQNSKSTWLAQLGGLLHSPNPSDPPKSPAPASPSVAQPSSSTGTVPAVRPEPGNTR